MTDKEYEQALNSVITDLELLKLIIKELEERMNERIKNV